MIKNFKPRLYQETILSTCVEKNTLVVLPTGMGKTQIFLMLAAQRLKQYPKSKILFLGPTRPLIEQYYNVFKKYFGIDEKDMVIFTGFVKPEIRHEQFKSAMIIFSTPQGLENDVIGGKISLKDVSLLGFDEAHRATGDYSYVFIAKQYHKNANYPRIIGLTASPGSDMQTITEVCKNLYVEDIEIRTENDPDVKPYIQDVEIDWIKVELPEDFKQIKSYLEQCFKSKLDEMKKHGYINSAQISTYSKKDLINLQAGLHAEIAHGNKDFNILKSISLLAEAMKVQHALELVETQGISSLITYMKKLMEQAVTGKVKAVKNLVKDINFRSAFIKTDKLHDNNVEHPKMDELKNIIKEQVEKDPKSKIMLFTQYRDTGKKIVDELEDVCKAELFVGQTKKGTTGISQKKQIEMLEKFSNNGFNCLVSTSVGEEGLDIPQVDVVIFYEPIPSAIRSIQRRGRTGRLEKGRVVVLIAKSTRDEAYRWSAHYKEKRMHKTLDDLKKNMGVVFQKPQPTLAKFIPGEDIKIFADSREKGSPVIKELVEFGVKIDLQRLETADYILSSRCAVEFKTVTDFVDSIVDGRLLSQIKAMKNNFERPLLIIEGTEDIYSVRKVHANAIRGMLSTIAVSYGVPIIQTKNFRETASLLLITAKREQDESGADFSMHGDRKPTTTREQQEYIVSSFPGVGATLAKPLLKKFKSIKNIVNAKEEKLKEVDLIGQKKAKAIREVLDSEYE